MQGYPQDSKARMLTTGKIPRRAPAIPTAPAILALVAEAETAPYNDDRAQLVDAVLDAYDVAYGIEDEGDGAPEPTQTDRAVHQLARIVVGLAQQLHAARARAALVDVPPIALRAALAEPYVCPECDEQACVCAWYDEPTGERAS